MCAQLFFLLEFSLLVSHQSRDLKPFRAHASNTVSCIMISSGMVRASDSRPILSAEWNEAGARLGSGGTRRVHGAPRHAAHRSDAARHSTVLSVPDGDRGRADVHLQADAEPGAGAAGGRQSAAPGLPYRADHGYTSSARKTA